MDKPNRRAIGDLMSSADRDHAGDSGGVASDLKARGIWNGERGSQDE